jgi:co-chaperonin GroES (HSP10)
MSELKREQFGNAASEQGAFDQGADFEGINHSVLPHSRPDPIEVTAEYVPGDGITLTPKKIDTGAFRQALGELREGPMDELLGQLCEEPETPEVGLTVRKIHGIEVQGNAARLAEIDKRSPREMLVYYAMHPEYDGAVAGDRIMVLRDIKESSYSCKACKGTGYEEDLTCGNCGGTAKETVRTDGGTAEVPCRACRVLGYGHEQGYSSGHKKCAKCNGSGWRGGIIIPEESQKEAITGIVVSLGPDTRTYKIGDRLMFSRFTGHTMEISKTTSYIIMRESEAIGILRQKGDWR